ncbi:MAG TPA: hypothetical protein VEU76_00185 [Candidatus Udaeobacter sp.]|nr:hypothetical protein [Candidatus Udaeobacter sp.]
MELIVVQGHRAMTESEGRSWSRPEAYRWLHYEDRDPVGRLAEGVEKLRIRGAEFDVEAVDKACAKASKTGFLN